MGGKIKRKAGGEPDTVLGRVREKVASHLGTAISNAYGFSVKA